MIKHKHLSLVLCQVALLSMLISCNIKKHEAIVPVSLDSIPALDIDKNDPLCQWRPIFINGMSIEAFGFNNGGDSQETTTNNVEMPKIVDAQRGYRISSIAMHPDSNTIVLVKECLINEEYTEYQLRLITGNDRSNKMLFSSKSLIHSLSWSPNGNRLAFLVGVEEPFVHWGPQELYVIERVHQEPSNVHRGQIKIRDSIGMMNLDQNAPQLIWNTNGSCLFWISECGILCGYDTRTLIMETYPVEGERVYKVDSDSITLAKYDPWRILEVSFEGDVIHEYATLFVEDIGPGFFWPRSNILSVVVRDRLVGKLRYSMGINIYTIFIDLNKKVILGKVKQAILGYLSSDAVSDLTLKIQ